MSVVKRTNPNKSSSLGRTEQKGFRLASKKLISRFIKNLNIIFILSNIIILEQIIEQIQDENSI